MHSLWMLDNGLPHGLSPLRVTGLFSFIILLGMILNVFVVAKMRRLAVRDRDQFLNGTGIYLCVMALSDFFSLLCILFNLTSSLFPEYVPVEMLAATCKMTVFTSRVLYTGSAYCWLFMSALRYLAAFHPLKYSTIWRFPHSILGIVLATSVLINLHLLVSVDGNEKLGCTNTNTSTSYLYSLCDIALGSAIPSSCIFCLDVRVLCSRYKRKTSDPLLQIVFHKIDEEAIMRREAKMRRFMTVTLVNLLISLPDTVFYGWKALFNESFILVVPPHLFFIAKTLYIFKTSFNAFYLTLYVFDRSILSKTSSSRQLSASARRLEENPSIVPRGRSHTVAIYQTSSSSSSAAAQQITRNKSCCALQQNKFFTP